MVKGFYICIWITVFKLCFCQLRMGLGNKSVLGKKYLVFFVKSPYSEPGDDSWLCAGAIVSPTQILTAAACLVDVNKVYVIAGYKKYVRVEDVEKDKCANRSKKKVVKISVPKEYTSSNAKQLDWMNLDIGVATVQQPYDFNDQSYLTHCSYVPQSIKINYDKTLEVENTRAIALGWGGKKAKAETEEEKLKPKLLQEATTNIIDKTFCTKLVPKNGSKEFVEKYLLCASGNGFLGEDGDETTSDPVLNKQSLNNSQTAENDTTESIDDSNEKSSRKSSLLETCQNDHGGPLITWIGAEEVILGVALNGLCNPNLDCVGPRIYVSTAATTDVIKCMLETNDTKRQICNDQIDDKQYQVNDIEIQWPEDSKSNSTSVRRQNDEGEPVQVRPTMNFHGDDEPQNPEHETLKNPQSYSQDNLQREPREKQYNSRKDNSQEFRELNTFYEPQNPPQAGQSGRSVNEDFNNQPVPQFKRFVTQQQPELQNQPETNSFNRPHPDSQNGPEIKGFNRPHSEYQNQPEIDTANQPQMESYSEPPMEPYYNQPPGDSYYNQPQIEPKSAPETNFYNQPQSKPKIQPPVIPNNKNPISRNSPKVTSFNQPHMEPQQPINNHQTKSRQPPQPMPKFKVPQEPLETSQVNSYNQPPIETFIQPALIKLQAEPYNKPQTNLESMKPSQSKGKLLSQTQYNMAPQSSYNNAQIQAYKPEPAKAYNPLDIIMADNQDEEVSFKHPIVQPFKPSPLERHKLPIISQPFMSNFEQRLEQPQLSQTNEPQPHLPQRAQPLRQPVVQASGQPSDPNRELRVQPRDPIMHPPQDEPQTFEQMFSQLHAGPEPVAPAPPPQEETFDEVYRNLHDGRIDEPIEQLFSPRMEQTVQQEQPVEQEQPIEPEVEQSETRINDWNMEVEATGKVQLRQQAPIDYEYK